MWLAMDTKALLTFVPSAPILNGFLTSIVFMIISWELSTTTNHICALVLPKDSTNVSAAKSIGYLLGLTAALGLLQGIAM